jgi:putative lipoic acid-binding regulatory protein
MENPFDKLRAQLELMEWPSVYFFKFIVPNNSKTVAQTASLFDNTADIQFHESKNGKFVSVSAKEMMLDVDSIIEIYEKAQHIPGIISL